ncbi:MAG: hypothetical protein ACYC2S_09840 [Spirochaetales bacterium]
MPGTIKTYLDFSGGFHTDTPSSFMADSDLSMAENCYWKDGLSIRKGYSVKATFEGKRIIGFLRSGISGTMRDYIIAKTDSSVILHIEDGLGYTTLPLSLISPLETAIRMVEYSGLIVIVGQGGHSRASIIQLSNGVYQETSIDALDTRKREYFDWNAGRASFGTYTDDTIAAQTGLWTLHPAFGEGFYIASDLVFNRIELKDVSAPIQAITVRISTKDGWKAVTPRIETIGTSTAIEFDLEFEGNEITFSPCVLDTPFKDQYAVEVSFLIEGEILSIRIESVTHTQYFRQITGNENPTDAAVYRSMLCLAAGNVVNFSPPDAISGWRGDDVEIFVEGGTGIRRIINFKDSMLVFKDRALYGFSGNSLNSPTVTRIADIGTDQPDSVVSLESEIMFVSGDKVLLYDGSTTAVVSDHIAKELAGKLTPKACAVADSEGRYFLQGASVGYLFLPATLRRNTAGSFLISVFKFTNHAFTGLGKRNDSSETVAWKDSTLYTLFSGTTDDGDPIALDIRTKDMDFGFPGSQKRFFRFKPIGMHNEEEDAEFLVEFTADKERTHAAWIKKADFAGFVSIPYEMDGFLLSVRLAAYSHSGAGIQGFALDMKGGTF